MPLTIRDATSDDENMLLAFLTGIQEAERALHPSRRPASEIVSIYLGNLQQRGADILIAQDGAQAVGFACGRLDNDDDPLLKAEWREHGWISDLYVAEERRAEGVSQLLLGAIAERLRGKGAKRLRICALAANVPAIRAYKAFGFSELEIVFDAPL
jgi:GNAT superfamily N-acetyltransferase